MKHRRPPEPLRLYRIMVDGVEVYAATDQNRFRREAVKYATVVNATFTPRAC